MDDLDQYFFFRTKQTLQLLIGAADVPDIETINGFFEANTQSRHVAATNCIGLFNRFSEENLEPDSIKKKATDERLQRLNEMYAFYKTKLEMRGQVDLSLLQQ